MLELQCNWFLCVARQGTQALGLVLRSNDCIAHAVKFVLVSVVSLRLFRPVYCWLFLFYGIYPPLREWHRFIGNYGRQALCRLSFSLFFACKPERALRINQNWERQVMYMNVKQKRKQNGRRVKPAHSTDWKMKRQAVSSLRLRNVAPMTRAVILPRRSRRGIWYVWQQ